MIYFSSYIGNMIYPNMICDYEKAYQLRNKTNCLFIDSGIFKKDRKISKLVRKQRIGNIVSSPDIMENKELTISNTFKWFNMIKFSHDIKDMCFVLQGKNKNEYIKCFEELSLTISDIKFIGIGGLANCSKNDVQIKEILSLIPYFKKKNLKVHIFGLGTRWIPLLLNYNPFSFDSSTPVRNAVDGCILNDNLKTIKITNNGTVKIRERLALINNYQIEKFIKNHKQDQQKLEIVNLKPLHLE